MCVVSFKKGILLEHVIEVSWGHQGQAALSLRVMDMKAVSDVIEFCRPTQINGGH